MGLEPATALAGATGRNYLEAPAGYGKTETIALALAICEGRQLILTHTHAGVDSLKKRLKLKGVPSSRYRVETIDAFCMRFSRGYPATSGFRELNDEDPEVWAKAKEGALRVFEVSSIREVISGAFSGVIVDEYQDCSRLQHKIVTTFAGSLPLRILGDPLQSLFTWKGQDPIVWDNDIVSGGFGELPPLTEPQRWLRPGSNRELGSWVCESRKYLARGVAPPYGPPVTLIETTKDGVNQGLLTAIYALRKTASKGEVILILHSRFRRPDGNNPKPHLRTTDPFASALSGQGFSVMMEVEGKLLRGWCKELEEMSGMALALGLSEFVDECCSKCTPELRPIVNGMIRGSLAGVRTQVAREILEWLRKYETSFDLTHAVEWLRILSRFSDRKMHHRELFDSMCLAIRGVCDGRSAHLSEAARAVREQQSHAGRRVEHRILARTLLVKGLQFDHVIVVCPEEMDACTQYVAFSRAVKSLTVLTTDKDRVKGQNRVTGMPKAARPQPSLFG